MRDELNDYKITNADGNARQLSNNEGRISYQNDSPRYINESLRSEQSENFRVSESFDSPKSESFDTISEMSGEDISSSASSSASSASSAASSSAASAASSVASAASSSFGVIAGTLASGVATAAIVVAVFVSTLVINLSLVMSDMYSLVFQVEMQGVQEEDFAEEADPIWAILTTDDGTMMGEPQQILRDTVYLTFMDLQPGTGYTITVKNSEKVFVNKVYYTASESNEKGQITAKIADGKIYVRVDNLNLKANEYYTLVAKDANGKAVWKKDAIDATVYTVDVPELMSLYFTMSVGGKVVAVSQVEYLPVPPTPEYDLTAPTWTWDGVSASLSFPEVKGGAPLVLAATVTSSKQDATCVADGFILYTATVDYGGETYFNEKNEILTVLGHAEGDWVVTVEPTCTEKGARHKVCTRCEIELVTEEMDALGHDYGEPEFIWTPIYASEEPVDPTPSPVIDGDVVLISADMLPDDEEHPTADLFSDFVSLTAEQVAHLEISTSGNVYVIYAFDEGGFYVGQYIDGVWNTSETMYPYHDMETTNADLREMIQEGLIHFAYPVSVPATEEPSDPPVAESMALNISDGDITIYSDGYVQNGDFHAFISTDSSRYCITGSRTGDHPLMISTKTHNDLIPAGTTSVYVIFDNMTLTGNSWCSALCIDAYSDLDLYVENVGTTTIRGDNHPAFAVGQESGSITIAITSYGGFETFRCERDDESTPTVYGSAAIQSVTMNGIAVDGNGGSLEPSPAEASDGPLTIVGYTAIARFTCTNDPTHVVELEAEITYADTAATCEANAYRTYTATILFGDKEYTEDKVDQYAETALGHSVSDWIVTLEPTCTEKGSRHKVCTVCEDELETEELDALGHDLAFIEGDWTCETGGTLDHYKCNRCNKLFDLEENEVEEEDVVLLATGHDWDTPVFTWRKTSDGYTATATFTCLNCSHVMEVPAEVELNGSTYVATVVVDDEPYEDQHGAPDLSVASGRIYIRPNDYIQNSAHSGNYTRFVSSENDPYVISGSTSSSPQAVDIFNFSQYNDDSGTYDGRWNDSTENFYFLLDELTVSLSGDYPVFNIRAEKDVNLYITLDSAVSLSGLSLFRAQGLGWTPTVNIYVTTQGYAFANSGSGNLYRAESGATVNLYLDGVRVDASGAAMPPEISLNEGNLFINASGYAIGGSDSCLNDATPFVSTAENSYVIENQEVDYCDNIIQIYQLDSGISTMNVYILLRNVTLEARSWASLIRIYAKNSVNIYFLAEGENSFVGGSGQQVFSSQGGYSPTVNIIVDQTTYGGTLNIESDDGVTYAESGTINVQYI